MWYIAHSSFRHQRHNVLISTAILLIISLSMSSAALAGSAVWSSTNIQYLYGTKYKLGDSTRSIITLEHVDGWKYGDNFFFVDITNANRTGDQTPTEFYAEISPRFSIGSLLGKDLSTGIFKDVLITTTLETGQGFHNYLYGLAVDLNIPNVKVFQINYYLRNEINANTDLGSQVTLVWLYPFDLGPAAITFEGFLDYAWGNKPKEDNLITAPRLLIDVGKFFDAPGQLQAGVEYQIWRNKFGIDGVDENVPQAMVKWIW